MSGTALDLHSGKSVAFVFPGQGAQYAGMGRDLFDQYAAARRIFEEADAVLGFALSQLCFRGPEAELTDTINAQPAILTMSAACLAVLRGAVLRETAPEQWVPAYAAGHSMGEYSALLAAGVLGFPDALRLVRERGRVMKAAGEAQPGAMAAVLGMPVASLRGICEEVGDVWVANDNAPGQIVLSGKKAALERASQLAKDRGARRAIPLAVSIAAHSPFMAPAANAMAVTLEHVPLAEAVVPVVGNVSAAPITHPADVRVELVQQLTSPVRWVESVQYMIRQGVQIFVEIGPKSTLKGLIQQIGPAAQTWCIGTVADIQALPKVPASRGQV